jgi:glycosyltransferase involved in cell wall biosynthesis
VSQNQADEMQPYLKKKPLVIGNIIDFAKFNKPRISVKNNYPVFNIGFLGYLENHKKRLDLLLKALSGVKSDYVLHIGGTGVFHEHYKSMATDLGVIDKCRWYGYVSHWEVPALMEKLEFFVSASGYETFGMAIVEAMAMGLPVVVADSGGPRDFVNEKNGIMVPKDDSDKLREGITKMMEQYKTYDPVYLRKFALENYSADVFLKKINTVYNSLKG